LGPNMPSLFFFLPSSLQRRWSVTWGLTDCSPHESSTKFKSLFPIGYSKLLGIFQDHGNYNNIPPILCPANGATPQIGSNPLHTSGNLKA